MQSYLDLVTRVLRAGVRKVNRTGIDTVSLFGETFRHDMADGFPLLTTKKMNLDSVAAELLWFLSGESDIKRLRDFTKIWDPWADEAGRVPYAYGEYWRKYPCYPDRLDSFDQLRAVIEMLRKDPTSRRGVVNAWFPPAALTSSLPPCHFTFVLNVHDGRLCCDMIMRSVDVGVGLPYNIASYALLLQLLAKELKMMPGLLVIHMVDCHIYICKDGDPGESKIMKGGLRKHEYDHTRPLEKQANLVPKGCPTVGMYVNGIDDALERCWKGDMPIDEAFHLMGYDPHPAIKMQVAV